MIVADDENLDIAEELGSVAVEQDNSLLGRKFNDGIEWACTFGNADHVVLIGSDDWVHIDFFDILPKQHAELPLPTPERPVVVGRPGPEILTGCEIALVDLARGKLRRCRGRGRFGVIPWLIPRAALLPSGFRPIRDDQNKGIDGALVRGLKCRPGWIFHDPHDLCRVDFKSDTNLNSYEKVTGSIGYGVEEDAWPLLASRFPEFTI